MWAVTGALRLVSGGWLSFSVWGVVGAVGSVVDAQRTLVVSPGVIQIAQVTQEDRRISC